MTLTTLSVLSVFVNSGAGAAGSSVAYYLTKFATAANVSANISVFEAAAHIGGRSTTVPVFGDQAQPVELGASIFVEVNRNLVSAVKELGLDINGQKSSSANASSTGSTEGISNTSTAANYSTAADGDDDNDDDDPGGFGVWNGAEFVWRMDDRRPSWWNTARLVWRYGLAPVRTQSLMRETIARFLRLYDPPHFPFASLTDAAHVLGLVDATAATGAEFLARHGIVTGAMGAAAGTNNVSTGSGNSSNSNKPDGCTGGECDADSQSASTSSLPSSPWLPSMRSWSWPWSTSMPGSPASYADEIIQASTRVNYAQNLARIHGLETMVCMAAEGGMSVRGGNWQIFARMLDAARARVHLGTRVMAITATTATNTTTDPALVLHTSRIRRPGGPAETASDTTDKATDNDAAGDITAEDSAAASDNDDTTPGAFDTVVLAAPFRFADIAVRAPLRLQHTPDSIPFVRLHVTLFASPRRLAPRFFGLAASERVPQYVLTTLPPGHKPGNSSSSSSSGSGSGSGDNNNDKNNHESNRIVARQQGDTAKEEEDGKGVDGGRERAGPAGFFSVSRVRTARNACVNVTDGRPRREYVYKIFAPARPTDEFIAALLGLYDAGTSTSTSTSSAQAQQPTAAAATTSSSPSATTPATVAEAPLSLSPLSLTSPLSSLSSSGMPSVPSATCSETRAKDGVSVASVNSSGDGVTWRHDKVWYSYPLLFPRVTFDAIRLADGLWYTGGVESFISTMETSSLMGMNVARLIVDEWTRQKQQQQEQTAEEQL